MNRKTKTKKPTPEVVKSAAPNIPPLELIPGLTVRETLTYKFLLDLVLYDASSMVVEEYKSLAQLTRKLGEWAAQNLT